MLGLGWPKLRLLRSTALQEGSGARKRLRNGLCSSLTGLCAVYLLHGSLPSDEGDQGPDEASLLMQPESPDRCAQSTWLQAVCIVQA